MLYVSPTLRLALGRSAVELTPRQGLSLAERLIRVSTRRMVEEEAALPCKPVRADRRKTAAR